MLDERLSRELREVYQRLYDEGKLLSREKLAEHYATFRERFGPERLQSLDGQALLETMHNHSNYDSLVYWLEFKNDEEFPARFGSIAGGSALKFGIYRRKETGAWMTGNPRQQRELTLDEAIEIARRHRDQLVRGSEALAELPSGGNDDGYRWLQRELDELAPDVSNTAWGHKYFCLLYPSKIEDYHVEHYQRFYLVKLLQVPPEVDGRYVCASRYVAVANELDVALHNLTGVLGHKYGRPHRYWKVIANYPDDEGYENNWDLMRDGGYVATHWPALGDLSSIQRDQESKTELRKMLWERYNAKGWTNDVFNFVAVMEEGDIVTAFERSTVCGIGRVAGPYVYEPSTPKIPHHRSVEWLYDRHWQLPETEGKGRAVGGLTRPANLAAIEQRILGAVPIETSRPDRVRLVPRLGGIPGRVQSILERKKQVILFGPPGTGKTYWARRTAEELASYARSGKPFGELPAEERDAIWGSDDGSAALVRVCTFHPAYGYEDFIEGYRPLEVNGQLVFERRDGIFKKLCDIASQKPDQRFYLIIDEINRGDIPRIFGELLTLLEGDKRGQTVLLPLSGDRFQVPENVYVIGTMNTADRSIALLDTALRRRFGFIELMPDSEILRDTVIENSIPLGPWLQALNERILAHIGRDARNLQIGHAYLLSDGRPVSDWGRFTRIVQDDILPLLQEYCYEDYTTLGKILGNDLVDVARQRIRTGLFDPARRDDLIRALLAPSPELSTSAEAVTSEVDEADENEDDSPEPGTAEGIPA